MSTSMEAIEPFMSSSNQHTKDNEGLGVERNRNQIFVPEVLEVLAQNRIFSSRLWDFH